MRDRGNRGLGTQGGRSVQDRRTAPGNRTKPGKRERMFTSRGIKLCAARGLTGEAGRRQQAPQREAGWV